MQASSQAMPDGGIDAITTAGRRHSHIVTKLDSY